MLRYEILTGDKHRYTVEEGAWLKEASTVLSFFHPARLPKHFYPRRVSTCARWLLGVLSLRDCRKYYRPYAIPQTPKTKFRKPSLLCVSAPFSAPISLCSPQFLQKLHNFTRVPDYIAYLAHILAAMPQEEDRIRTIAGYLLKNNAPLILKASSGVAEYVKAAVLSAFSDPSAIVRTAAGQDIVAFLGVLEPRNWPDCLEQLVGMLDDPSRQEVSPQPLETRALHVHAVTLVNVC